MPDSGGPPGDDDESRERQDRRPSTEGPEPGDVDENDGGVERAPDRDERAPPAERTEPRPAEDRSRGEGRGPRSDPPTPEGSRDEPAEGSTGKGSILTFLREIVTTVGAVVLVGLVLFGVSGVWPPLVAVESGSMEPHMYKGDLVFIVEEGRFAPQNATEGIVTHRIGRQTGYWSFGDYGNVIVYRPHEAIGTGEFRSNGGPPVIHRAQFYVEKGQNWVAMANESYLGTIDDCRDVASCPAPHDGFITKGDHNGRYDQATGLSTVVKKEWIRGTAKFRIPWLGCVRLQLSGDSCA